MERVIASGKHHIEHITIDGSYGACWGRFMGVSRDGCQIDELFSDVYSFERMFEKSNLLLTLATRSRGTIQTKPTCVG
ncbi:hypothetical protein [Nodularia sphaerocarpa]|uniref:hypothetical protein n=1 Tax=Nodularia sphaerocarpa TaxID=137816 RepID=UPI001EFB456D|nr:hypothetical protein [Nodularia sphaerocarpa]MDB9373595.1 hypothetical protein [Nodularia sphaerocarpa CS-585]